MQRVNSIDWDFMANLVPVLGATLPLFINTPTLPIGVEYDVVCTMSGLRGACE